MNLIELATGTKSSEMKVVSVVVVVLACNALGIDATVVLSLIFDSSELIRYSELIKAAKGANPATSDASTWALAMIGVGYPIARAYVKKLKSDLIMHGKEQK